MESCGTTAFLSHSFGGIGIQRMGHRNILLVHERLLQLSFCMMNATTVRVQKAPNVSYCPTHRFFHSFGQLPDDPSPVLLLFIYSNMGRECAECQQWCSNSAFSRNNGQRASVIRVAVTASMGITRTINVLPVLVDSTVKMS